MPKRSADKRALPPEIQLALGAELRLALGDWAHRLPWNLISLAHRVSIAWSDGRPSPPADPPIKTFDQNLFDPPTISILDKAFQQAWKDLQSVHHPVTPEALALCLAELVRVEREPARLATKAVIQIILPAASQSARLSR